MAYSVTDAMVLQFGTNVRHLAQQKGSRLRPAVYEDTVTGEAAYLEQLAPTAARKVLARHGDSPMMNSQHLRRQVAIYDYDWGDLVDRLDKVRLLEDPASEYAIAANNALKRGYDDEIIAAAFGPARAGHSGGTIITWPNGSTESTPAQPGGAVIVVNDWSYGIASGNAPLTISKLISAKVALMAAEGDEDEEYYLSCPAAQIGALLSTTEATSADYNSVRALVDGNIDQYMGFKFLRSERLQVNASGQRRVIAWRKSGLGLAIGRDIESQMAQRPDKRFATYVYCDTAIGATRMEEVKLCEIVCV